jgi:hypothetical protein
VADAAGELAAGPGIADPAREITRRKLMR